MRKSIKVKYKSQVKKVTKVMARGALLKLRALGALLKADLQEKLTGPRSGHDYWIPELRVWYTASAPGEYPAERLGDLRSSIKFKVGMEASGPFLALGTDMPYGAKLEATQRPFITRVILENQDLIKAFLL